MNQDEVAYGSGVRRELIRTALYAGAWLLAAFAAGCAVWIIQSYNCKSAGGSYRFVSTQMTVMCLTADGRVVP